MKMMELKTRGLYTVRIFIVAGSINLSGIQHGFSIYSYIYP